MAEYVTLLGAEDVRRAGHQMASAAEDINRALLSLDQTLSLYVERVERALDEHAARIEAAMRPAESGEEESDG